MLEQGLFFDVFPKLNMAMFESQMGSATRRAETAANEMARAISGHDYFASPTTQLDRFVARMETQMRAANNIMDRATERQIAAADRVETAELRKNAAIKRSEEVLAATRDANSARYLQALATQRKAEQDYAAAVRANSAAQAMFVRAQAGVTEASRRQEEATVASAAALGRLGTAATNIGAVVGVGMAGAFAVGASKAGDLEKGLKLLVTGADESEKSIGILRQGVLDLQSQWGTAASEQEKALLLIERAGYHGADALKVLTAGVQAAKAEGSNLSTVVHQLTTTMTDFKNTPMGNFTVDIEHVNSVMSMSVEAAALSKSTLEEYARAIGNVEEAARNAGMNMQGLNAAFAVMTQHGNTAENASQQINHAILTLVAPQAPQQQALNQFGISTAQVQQWIADPNIQLGGAVQRIQDAIDSRVGKDGRVHIDPHQVNADAQRALAAEEATMTPFQRRIIENFKGSGEITSESFNKVLNGLKEDDRAQLMQWRSLHNNQVGFNRLLRKGFNPDMTVEQAQKALFGDSPTLKVAQNLVGDENQEMYHEKFEKLNADGHPDEHGSVKGSADSQQTLKAQLADLRGALNTDLTQMGESSQGPLTKFVHSLVDLAKFLGEHQGALQAAGIAGLGLLGTLGVVKGGNAIGRMFGAGDAAFGGFIGRNVGRGARNVGRGARNISSAAASRAGTAAWMARQAALDAAMAAPGAARRNVRGLAGRNGSSIGGQVRNAAIGGMDVLGRARGSRAARWAGRAGVIGLPLALMAASAGMSRADDGSGAGGGMGDAAMMAMTALPMVGMVGPSLSGVGSAARTGLTGISAAGKGAAETLKGVGKAATELPGKIKAVATGTKAWTAAQLLLDAAMNANPIGIAVVAIAALTAGIIYAYNHSEKFRNIVQGALHAVGNAFKSVYDSLIKPFFENFKRIFSDAWDIAKNIFGFWKDLLTGDFSGAWGHVQTVVSDVVDAVKGYLGVLGTAIKDIYDVTLRPTVDSIGNALGKVKNFFGDTVDWVKTEWGKLEQIAEKPIKWIIEHVYNGGIAPVWNKIDGIFGGHHHLPNISFQAAGGGIWSGPGTLPGYKPGIDEVNAKLSPGESVLTPEASKKLGYGTIMRLNRESGRPSANEMMGHTIRAAGGFLGGWVGSAWDDVKDAAGFATKVLADPVGSVKSLFAKTLGENDNTPGGTSQWRQELVDIPKHFVAQAIETAKGWVGLGKHNAGAAAGTPWTGSGTLDGWITKAMEIAGVDPGHWGSRLHTLIGRESGGNPNAINRTDINAKNGDPSRGLMQTTGATFERFHDPSLGNIYDPIANIVAGIHYIQSRYGDIDNVQQAHPELPPKGYAGGGINDPHLSESEKDRETGHTTSPFKLPSAAANDRTAIERAWSYIHSVAGTAYQYGGLDCSMFMSGIYQSLLGRDPGIRAFNTMSDFLALGFRRGLGGIFQIGVNPKPGMTGHMAGTFDGQPVESGGAHGDVAFGPTAANASDSQFPDKYYLPGSLFSPPFKGENAKPTEGQSQANKLHDKARKLRDQITKLQGQEKRANDSAAKRDEAAKKAEEDAAKYEEKASQQVLESSKQKLIEQAQKARVRAQNARVAAQKDRDRAGTYHQRAQDAEVQANQADSDADTAWGSPAQIKPGKKGSSDPNHLMTFTEFGEKAGGILAGGLLETFGLQDTVFADPNKSYLLRIGNALVNPFAKAPQQQDQEDAEDDYSSSTDSYDDSYTDSGVDDSDSDAPFSADDMASPDDSLNPDTSLDDEDTDSSSLPNPGMGDVDPEAPLPTLPGYPGLGTTAPSSPHGARADGDEWGGKPVVPKSQQLFEQLLNTTPQLHDSGGLLQPGLTLVNNATGVPEAVLAPREKTNLELIARMGLGHPFLGGNSPRSWVHIENLHQNSGEDGHDTGRRIAREMNAFSGSGPR